MGRCLKLARRPALPKRSRSASPPSDRSTSSLGTETETWNRFWKSRESAEAFYPAVSDIKRHLLAVTGSPANLQILEVGAGTGRVGHDLAALGAHVTLLDASPEALSLSRQISPLPSFVQADALQVPFPEDAFDVIFHQGLLEHFPDPLPLLREEVRVLRRGGYLLVDVPQRYHLYTLAKNLLMLAGRWFAGWETSYSVRELEAVCRSVGLVPVYRYGSFMKPSFLYRVVREVFRKVNIVLPQDPTPASLLPLRDRYHRLLERLESYPALQNLTQSVGVIAQKP